MSSTSKFFNHTHYSVSTVAAVLYAIAWLVGNQVRAEVINGYALPAVVVTAQRVTQEPTMLEPVLVTARRDVQASYAVLSPVIVSAPRDVLSADARNGATNVVVSHASANANHRSNLFTKLRAWMRTQVSHIRA